MLRLKHKGPFPAFLPELVEGGKRRKFLYKIVTLIYGTTGALGIIK